MDYSQEKLAEAQRTLRHAVTYQVPTTLTLPLYIPLNSVLEPVVQAIDQKLFVNASATMLDLMLLQALGTG